MDSILARKTGERMRDLPLILFTIVWMLYGLLDVVDFTFQLGEKNQVVIEKVEKKEPKKETNEIKADW